MTLSKQEKSQIDGIDERLRKMEGKLSRIQNMVIGILIGVAIGAVIFGVMSVKELLHLVK